MNVDRKMYGLMPFVVALNIVEIPHVAMATMLFSSIFYWLAGFQSTEFGFFILVLFINNMFSLSLGQLVAVSVASEATAQHVNFMNMFVIKNITLIELLLILRLFQMSRTLSP